MWRPRGYCPSGILTMSRLHVLFACSLAVSLMGGCKRRDEVRVLEVPKEPKFMLPQADDSNLPAEETALEARMLAAFVPYQQRVWFFKMIGSPSDVRVQRGEFRQLLKSLSFDDQGEPQWELPDTWSEQAGNGMRKATLKAGASDRAPSVSVIGLAAPQEVLSNVNRWREQLQLPSVTADELERYVDTFEVAGAKVTLADMIGTVNPQAAMGRPMPASPAAGRSGSAAAARRKSQDASRSAPPGSRSEFTFDVPTNWTAAPPGGMRKASFGVRDGEQQVEITVITLPPTSGEVLPNVNRWRGQLGREPLDQGSLATAVKTVQISGQAGHYMKRVAQNTSGDGLATVAAMVPHAGSIWFFKLTGDGALVEREEANFEKFLESVKFAD